MSLTFGTGPLSRGAAGEFNGRLELPEPLIYFEPYLPRVRALFEGEIVVDSLRTRLLHESGRLPVFYFPLEDVREDLLEPSSTTADVPGERDRLPSHASHRRPGGPRRGLDVRGARRLGGIPRRSMGAMALELGTAEGLKAALRALGTPGLVYRNVIRANAAPAASAERAAGAYGRQWTS